MTTIRTFESEQEERAALIQDMLDKIMPFPNDATEQDRQTIDAERQALVLRTEWTSMTIEKLRQVALQ